MKWRFKNQISQSHSSAKYK